MAKVKKKETNRKKLLKNEDGAVAVVAALFMVVLLMFSAIVVDYGMLYLKESKLQTACDAAALAAASKLPNVEQAKYAARDIMKDNGFELDTYTEILFSADNTEVEITKKITVETSFAKVMNIDEMKTKKSAKAAAGEKKVPFTLDYALFSGSESTSLNLGGGSIRVDGRVHTNHDLSTWNSVAVYGDVECKNHWNSGSFTQDGLGTVKSGYETVGIPDYDATIMEKVPEGGYSSYTNLTSYRNATGQNSSNPIIINGNVIFDTVENLGNIGVIINGNVKIKDEETPEFGGNVTIKDGCGVYSENGNLNICGNLSIGGGYIIADKKINIQGQINDEVASKQAVIYSKNEGIILNGATVMVYALLYAPNGQVNFQNWGSYNIHGGVIANQIEFSGGSFYIWKDFRAWEMEIDTTIGGDSDSSASQSRLIN